MQGAVAMTTADSPRVCVTRLSLTDVRNHAATAIDADARPVCLHGANGAGKTAILEALSLLVPGRGLRGAELPEIARRGGLGGWTVAARLERPGEEPAQLGVGLEIGPDGRPRRIVRVDGRNGGLADIAAIARMAWITPAMDRLFMGPAGDRRRFLDRMVLGHVPDHAAWSAAYERAMRSRQKLLESGTRGAWLDGAEAEMARAGAAMLQARATVLARLGKAAAAAAHADIFPPADLALTGALEALAAEGADQGALEQGLARALASGRGRDGAAGRAIDGPHRTDLQVLHAARGLPAGDCSTGEQKGLLFALVIANAHAIAAAEAVWPILLIDEAGAHFDAARRAALFEVLLTLGGQVWLTGTEAALFDAFDGRARLIEVRDGHLA